MDLYANEFTTFRKITLPLIMPGVLAAAMLAFALSIDDFVITQFNAGPDITFPLFLLSTWMNSREWRPYRRYPCGTSDRSPPGS